MKKIVTIAAAMACAASMFAVDFSARAVMEGQIAKGSFVKDKDPTAQIWNLSKKDQKDADALIMSVNAGNAGAQFQFWYNYDGSGAAPLNVRNTNIWFKPIDSLKITVGDVSYSTYKEMIDWWKVADGQSASAHGRWTWSGFSTVEGSGIGCEWSPIAGLDLNAGVTAGAGNDFASLEKEKSTYAAWGAGAKYSLSGMGLPASVAVSYRDAGKGKEKILSIGADYGNNWADGFYGFINARLRFEDLSYSKLDAAAAKPGFSGKEYSWNKEGALSAVAFDNYFKFSTGAFKVLARIPVTIRTTKDLVDGKQKASDYGFTDPSYMSYELKAFYALDGFTAYVDIENDTAVTFNDKFAETALDMFVQPGVTFNVGSAAFDIGLQLDIPNKEGAALAWSVPFNVAVAF